MSEIAIYQQLPETEVHFPVIKCLLRGGSGDGTPAGPVRDKRVTPSCLCPIRTVHQSLSIGHHDQLAGHHLFISAKFNLHRSGNDVVFLRHDLLTLDVAL